MKKYVIFGHCNSALSLLLESIYKLNKEENIHIYIVYFESDIYDVFYGLTYKPFKNIKTTEMSINDFKLDFLQNANVLIAAMDSDKRIEAYNYCYNNFKIKPSKYDFIYHPTSSVSSSSSIGNGCYFGPNSSISVFTKIKNFTYINRNATIGHHTTIGSFCSLNPGCNIGGNTTIGSNVTIGIGANIFDNILIGENVIIGGGSVVTKNIPSNSVAFGIPAKIVKEQKK